MCVVCDRDRGVLCQRGRELGDAVRDTLASKLRYFAVHKEHSAWLTEKHQDATAAFRAHVDGEVVEA